MIEQVMKTERQALITVFRVALQSVDAYEAVAHYAMKLL